MSKSEQRSLQQLGPILQALYRKNPPLFLLGVGVLVVLALVWAASRRPADPDGTGGGPTPPAAPADGYLFCFWNVENFFDDKDDPRNRTDEPYDNRFAQNPELLREKLGNLSKVLLSMNDGKGPDILAMAEVESERAAELLRERLNADLGGKAEPYEHLLFKENKPGRHIATGILTRLPVRADRTRKLDNSRRILEGHVVVNGHQLVIIASHWTSRLSDEEGVSEGRAKYADLIYGRFKEMYLANPDIDFLVCGDFNDDPTDRSVTDHLRATGDRSALVNQSGEPRLFNLTAGKDPEKFGTLKHGSKWHLFDQLIVAPGLLDDKGWTCLPDTVTTVQEPMWNKFKRPWRFDEDYNGRKVTSGAGRRGFADHFPVTVRLKVQGG